jgi:hypothetical protein
VPGSIDNIVSAFELHQRTPEVSLEMHERNARISLGERLSSKTLVYLDTKYWIILRQAVGNAEANGKHANLLALLRTKVASGVLLCPISASTFIELMKQDDPQSRLSTASLIDELSQGVALVEDDQRIKTEISCFLYAKGTTESLHALEHLAWCKLVYVLGSMHPTGTPFDAATELVIQKAFFDYMWTVPLTEIVQKLESSKFGDAADFGAIAEKLNQGNLLHSGSLRNFVQTYSAEVRGLIDLQGEAILSFVEAAARKQGIPIEYQSENDRFAAISPFKNVLAFALESNQSSKEARNILRTIHVQACLHASVRWNKKRKLEGNDLLDFHHAAAALAYCDAFFTERSLKTLITQNHVALDKCYDCRVIARPDEAIDYLNGLT